MRPGAQTVCIDFLDIFLCFGGIRFLNYADDRILVVSNNPTHCVRVIEGYGEQVQILTVCNDSFERFQRN